MSGICRIDISWLRSRFTSICTSFFKPQTIGEWWTDHHSEGTGKRMVSGKAAYPAIFSLHPTSWDFCKNYEAHWINQCLCDKNINLLDSKIGQEKPWTHSVRQNAAPSGEKRFRMMNPRPDWIIKWASESRDRTRLVPIGLSEDIKKQKAKHLIAKQTL